MFLLLFLPLVGCLPGITPPITPVIEDQAPVITSVHIPTTATVGVAYTYDVEATDPDGDTLTYSLDVKPSGMTIDSATGVIKWIPYSNQVGVNPVTVKVSDGTLSDTQSFTILVSKVEEEEYVGGGGGYVPTLVKLTKIVVEPDEMILFVGQTVPEELFDTYSISITAYYSDGPAKDIDFGHCEYDITAVGGILEVSEDGDEVTAIEEGRGDILISYTDEESGITKTDTLTIIVIYLPMEIIADMPTFTVGEEEEFTVEIVANSDVGKTVLVSLTILVGDYKVYYWDDVKGWLYLEEGVEVIFGGTGFPLCDEVMLFKGTFNTVGTYETTVEVRTVPDDVLLCSKVISAVVEGPITIRWLEDAVRYNADGSFNQAWQDNYIPSPNYGKNPSANPATLTLTGGEYHFADIEEFFNLLMDYEGDVVITEAGVLSGWATYTLDELPIENDFVGQNLI